MVKIYVATQREVLTPSLSAFTAINPDINSGDHISEKSGYSELRAHYWVWKNATTQADMIGFFQFRRYLDYAKTNTDIPYTIRERPLNSDFNDIDAIQRYDILAPLPEFTGETVWRRYAAKHRVQDLQLVYDIIMRDYPDYQPHANSYLNGKSEYYGNLYIMKSQALNAYFKWLFGVLDRYDALADDILPRTQGYLAERLFGIWFMKAKADGVYRYKEVPRVHFSCFDDATHHLRREKMVNCFLPPGSMRRVYFKRLVGR